MQVIKLQTYVAHRQRQRLFKANKIYLLYKKNDTKTTSYNCKYCTTYTVPIICVTTYCNQSIVSKSVHGYSRVTMVRYCPPHIWIHNIAPQLHHTLVYSKTSTHIYIFKEIKNQSHYILSFIFKTLLYTCYYLHINNL